jgi:hypothetical protein
MTAAPALAQRAAALAILLGLAWMAAAGVAAPVLRAFDARIERVADLEIELARASRLAAAADEAERAADRAQAAQNGDGWMLTAETPALAAAQLQAQVKRLAGELDGAMPRIEAEPEAEAEGPLPMIRLTAEATVPQAALESFLRRLETEAPRPRIRTLRIERAARGIGGGDDRPPLTARLTLAAPMRDAAP